jgi:serine protease
MPSLIFFGRVGMRQLIVLFFNFLLILTTACSDTNSSSDELGPVRIGYLAKETLAPAHWIFKADSDEEISTYQWQFSDDRYLSRLSARSESVDHVFQQPGTYLVRLQYRTSAGEEGTAEVEISIGSGHISGTVLAAVDNLVDVDTRDPDEPSGNNDSFDNAQAISAISRLSGVVDANDIVDFFQVQLQQSQRISLQVADDNGQGQYGQLRLELFASTDQNTALITIETDLNNGQLPTAAIIPSDGDYFIKLTALNPMHFISESQTSIHSHGNYSMAIERVINSAIQGEFVAGEINIMLRPERQYQAQGLRSVVDMGRIKTISLENAQLFLADHNVQYKMQSLTSEEELDWQTLQVIEALKGHSDILYAEPNFKRYSSALSPLNDPYYSAQWHYNTINLGQAWQVLGHRGDSAITVAVLDTGVLLAHPDLSGNLVAGYDFVGDGLTTHSEDDDPNDPGDKSINGQRSSFHGTHVAGTIAATAVNSIGGAGVAPNVKIMPVRVLGQDGGTVSGILKGLCFAAQLSSSNSDLCNNSISASSAADIINLSLGGASFSQIEQELYKAVADKGIIVIAAAGNESTSIPSYPAAYDNVISVAAINSNLEQSSYSNFGPTIDVTAPGGDFSVDRGVFSTWGDDRLESTLLTYGSLQGTSMAAPHVAGVAALMKSVKADLTHAEFLTHLNAGRLTQDLGSNGRDDIFGMGLIDAQKAVLQVMQDLGPQVSSSKNHIYFNVSHASIDFVLTAIGVDHDADLGEISVQIRGAENNDGGFWLQLNKQSGLGNYTAIVDRSGLLEGVYQAELVVSSSLSNIDDIVIVVQLQVGNPELSANAGVQYVVIIDENAQPNAEGVLPSVAGSSALIASQGRYSYQILGLKKGNYTVSTGSDLDLDSIICDAGESCGQYPTLGQSKTITISEDQPQVEVNMSVNYVNTSTTSLMSGARSMPISVYRGAQPVVLKTLDK